MIQRSVNLRDGIPGCNWTCSDRSEGRGDVPVRMINPMRHLRALQSPEGFTTLTSCSQILVERWYRIGHNPPECSRIGLIVAFRKTLETTFVAHWLLEGLYVRHFNIASQLPRGCHAFEPYQVDRGFDHGEPGHGFFEALPPTYRSR